MWSVASFVLEVPSGAWADLVDRRLLLVISGLLYAGCFATWLLAPVYAGFLVGFLLWAASSALMSGTFEAFLFDELDATGRAGDFGRMMSLSGTAAVATMGVAVAAAAPLYAWGGYRLIGAVSIGLALLHSALAMWLPRAPRRTVEGTPLGAYVTTLRSGVHEARASVAVRRVLLAQAALAAVVGVDEFLPLVFADGGAAPSLVAWLGAGLVALQAVANAAANRVSRVSAGRLSLVTLAAGVLLVVGGTVAGAGGWLAIWLGYAAATAAYVSGEIRLQSAITGPARATVTSVNGLGTEVGFVTTVGAMGVATTAWPVGPAMSVVVLVVAAVAGVAAARIDPGGPGGETPLRPPLAAG